MVIYLKRSTKKLFELLRALIETAKPIIVYHTEQTFLLLLDLFTFYS